MNSSTPSDLKHFTKIAYFPQAFPQMVEEVKTKGERWWNTVKDRTWYDESPFKDTDDIILRFNEDTSDINRVITQREMVNYPAWHAFTIVRENIYALNYFVRGLRIGRALLSRLPPGKVMTPHVDPGRTSEYYDRFHICLQADEGSIFHCGDEQVVMRPGETWWFNNKEFHSVENKGQVDRLHLIVDIRL